MSSQTDSLTDKLQRAYASVILQIVHNLEKDQQDELRFYCNGLITKGDTGALGILRSLENAGKISWEDVGFLRECLHEVQRLDLSETLTRYEIKRDFAILLDVYARKKQGLESFRLLHAFESVEKVAGCLVILVTKVARDRFDVSNAVGSLIEDRKSIRNILADFEEETERELTDSWSKLTLLVVIAGEIVAAALASEEYRQKTEAPKLCSIAAEELCARMMKQGSWEEFCDHVEEQYNRVYRQQNAVLDESSLIVKKKVAGVVQKLKETTFFL